MELMSYKGLAGALARTLKGIPPCVWVRNQHDDEITVVVSKYRPKRLLSGVEVNLSATGGGGVGFYSTVKNPLIFAYRNNRCANEAMKTYMGPATTKTLTPETKNRQASLAVFPLWTRSDGFGVVSIFKGLDRLLYIENDRIPAGATAYFRNTPDLTIVSYREQPALSQ